MNQLKIKLTDLNSIFPYEKNAKKHPATQVSELAKSISNFGFNVPILVDKSKTIITGHARYLAAQKLNLKKVPVAVLDTLTPEQIKKFRLADNKVAESKWDETLLIEDLQELKATGSNILDIPGFMEFDMDELQKNLTKQIILKKKKLEKPIKKIHILLSIKTENFHEISSQIKELSLNKNLEIIQNGN